MSFTILQSQNVRVDAAARFHHRIAGPVMMCEILPPLSSDDLLCGTTGDKSALFDILTKDDAHTIDID